MVDLNGTLLMQIVNFIILCPILGHFCYKPVLKVLDDRKARIKNDLDSAAQSKAAAEELKVSYEAQLKTHRQKPRKLWTKQSRKPRCRRRHRLMKPMHLSPKQRNRPASRSKENARMLWRI